MPGGKYYNQRLYAIYGSDAAASWGPMQIMYVTATELGFNGNPSDLSDPEVCMYWATTLINKRILGRGARTIEQIADAYNSGSFKDNVIPEDYINSVINYYKQLDNSE